MDAALSLSLLLQRRSLTGLYPLAALRPSVPGKSDCE